MTLTDYYGIDVRVANPAHIEKKGRPDLLGLDMDPISFAPEAKRRELTRSRLPLL